MVIWIIGLAGSGKSTVAETLMYSFRKAKKPTILLDGDVIRDVFGNDLGFSRQDRLINASRMRSLSQMIDAQDINVICSILSISQADRDWCREHTKVFQRNIYRCSN